ncbi:MAG: 2-polyprenyl-3-methyl-6-methoxy-1,4-benzoquinone monooxygenase [Arenicellales bacterium]
MKTYSPIDKFIMGVDQALVTVLGKPHTTGRAYPAAALDDDADISETEKQEAMRLMRVNHVGEVCAQALYQSQAMTARSSETKQKMHESSMEENDHLDWCEQRIEELGGRKSLLNPVWYAGSFAIGTIAGLAGDRWSLGFVEETENQVVQHLDEHLERLSPDDHRSRAIVEQMKIDEGEHATAATKAGASALPEPIKRGMQLMSKVMTKTVYWV